MRDDRLIVLGAGRQGAETIEIAKEIAKAETGLIVMGFIDDYSTSQEVNGFPILGGIEAAESILDKYPKTKMIAAIGDTEARMKSVSKYEKLGFKFTNLVHPSSHLSESVDLGLGVVVAAGCVITVNVQIGNHVIINPITSIAHDVTIGDFTTINAHSAISGNNHIGKGVYLGVGARTIQDVTIGDWTLVGAGAVVTQSLPSHVVVVGIPAKPINHNQ